MNRPIPLPNGAQPQPGTLKKVAPFEPRVVVRLKSGRIIERERVQVEYEAINIGPNIVSVNVKLTDAQGKFVRWPVAEVEEMEVETSKIAQSALQ